MKYSKMKDSGVAWLGQIPSHWSILRGKYCLKLLSRPVLDDDEVVTCFRDGEVTLRKNRREEGFTNALLECGYQGVEPGDLVVHGMDGFAGAIGISDSRGKASPVLNVMDSKHNKRFIMYYLRTLATREVFLALATGIRVRSCDLRWNKLASIPYILPPLPEQNAIAEYLDEKCGAIDEIISEAKATIEEYKAWKASVIFEAVTKGLAPNAEMKDSGVKWIGKIPKHWSLNHIRKHAEFYNGDRGVNYPKSEDFVVSGIPFLTSYNLDNDIVDTIHHCKYITSEKYQSLGGAKLAINDIVFCLRGSIGKCAINLTENAGTVASSLMTIRARDISSKFLLYLLLSNVAEAQTYLSMNGTCAANLSAEDVSLYTIPIPPPHEQNIIADYLDEKCTAIDQIIAEKEALIADMESYKKSLIFECVTGKRKVC